MTTTASIDENKLNAFMGQFVQDLGTALSVATVILGDQLGLYKAMSDGRPLTPEELARRTGTDARYVREWLCSQAASGYVRYDAEGERFALEPEQALALAHEDGHDRVIFEVSSAKDFPGTGNDLVAMFDCLHDMGDPVGAARHVREVLAPEGTWMTVEWCARRPRATRRSASPSGLRPVRGVWATWCGRAASRASRAPPRRPSTWG